MTHKRYPITNHGKVDERYSIEIVAIGYAKPHYVVYFCDKMVGHSEYYGSALMLAMGHNTKRKGALVIEGVPA